MVDRFEGFMHHQHQSIVLSSLGGFFFLFFSFPFRGDIIQAPLHFFPLSFLVLVVKDDVDEEHVRVYIYLYTVYIYIFINHFVP